MTEQPSDPVSGAARAETIAAFLLALRRRGIRSNAVLSALESVPRERFVDDDLTALAYGDHALPIACGQTISQPYIVALMTEALGIDTDDSVLEIGTGSGYQTAVLARLARRVVSVERYAHLARLARGRLDALGIDNVEIHVADGYQGWAEAAPYSRILVTAVAPEIPEALKTQLADPGCLVAPIGTTGGDQRLVRLRRAAGTDAIDDLAAVRFVPLTEGISLSEQA